MRSTLILLFLIIVFPCFSAPKSNGTGIKTVVIDPGHGGKDPGAVVGNAREKNIVLDIGLKLGEMINKNLPDVKVIYTRDKDFFVPLFERAQIANKNSADLFISIHANYCGTPSVKGTETYVLGLHRTQDNLDVAKKENSVILLEDDYTTRYEGFDPNLSESYIMFELIQDNYIEQSVTFAGMIQNQLRLHAQRADRDVRQAGFLVLRETAMPSVLVEAGYLSNKNENAYLLTAKGREEIASAIYKSLFDYKNKFESRLKQSAQPEKSAVAKNKPEIVDNTITETAPKKEVVDVAKKETTKSTGTLQPEATFAIQIASSQKRIPLNSRAGKGIKGVKELSVKGTYKYICYEYADLDETKRNLSQIRKKIDGAFIVGVRNGTTMSVNEALKGN